MNEAITCMPLQGQFKKISKYGYIGAQKILSLIRKRFPGSIDNGQSREYRIADISIDTALDIVAEIRKVEPDLRTQMLLPDRHSFNIFQLHGYHRNDDTSKPDVYFTEECSDISMIVIVDDGVDIYLTYEKETMKVLATAGECIVMNPRVRFEIKNVKREGCFILAKIAPLEMSL